jgi:predicted nucleic acid-binding protein
VTVVIDTSVAVKWVVPDDGFGIERGAEAALALLADELLAPDCIMGEFANALFKKVRRSEIGEEQARAAFAILPETVALFPTATLVEPALDLALDIVHPVHDCIFLVGAIQRGVPLVTADMKFYKNCMRTGRPYPIKLLGDGG